MHVNYLKTGGKRPLREIQHVLEEPSKANKKAKPHALAMCPSLGNNENKLEPCTPVAQTASSKVYRTLQPVGFLEQLYHRLRKQQAKGKPLHIEDHVKTIEDALGKALQAKNQDLESWSDKGWYEQFLAIKQKTQAEALSHLKENFKTVFDDASLKKRIQDEVATRQAEWADPAKPGASKENFIRDLNGRLAELLGIQEKGEAEIINPYVDALLEAEQRFLQKNVYAKREDLYLSSFGVVSWYHLLSQQDKGPKSFKTVQKKLVDQIIDGLKTEGEQVIHSAEESLRQLDLLLDLLNPDKT